MTAPAARAPMTAAEYLAWEREQTEKHEFHRGEIFAMAGGSARHNALAAELVGALITALRGKGCRVLSSDQKIGVEPGERYLYADAVVACGGVKLEPGTSDVLANPMVVVEVLSPSTEAYDRGDKWSAYQRVESMRDYVLVSQSEVRVEHYQRATDGSWRYRALGPGDQLVLTEGARVSVDAVYEGAFDVPGG